jgi:hypothetical protein
MNNILYVVVLAAFVKPNLQFLLLGLDDRLLDYEVRLMGDLSSFGLLRIL